MRVLRELLYFGIEMQTGRARLSQFKAGRRLEKRKGTARLKREVPSQSNLPPDVSTLQKEDPALMAWFEKVTF